MEPQPWLAPWFSTSASSHTCRHVTYMRAAPPPTGPSYPSPAHWPPLSPGDLRRGPCRGSGNWFWLFRQGILGPSYLEQGLEQGARAPGGHHLSVHRLLTGGRHTGGGRVRKPRPVPLQLGSEGGATSPGRKAWTRRLHRERGQGQDNDWEVSRADEDDILRSRKSANPEEEK